MRSFCAGNSCSTTHPQGRRTRDQPMADRLVFCLLPELLPLGRSGFSIGADGVVYRSSFRALRSFRRQGCADAVTAVRRCLRPLRRGRSRGALHRPHTQPARAAGTAAAALGKTPAPPAASRPGAAYRVPADRLGVRVTSNPVQHARRDLRHEGLERMHLRAPAFIRYLGSNAYPASW